jgi:hypothetical protein
MTDCAGTDGHTLGGRIARGVDGLGLNATGQYTTRYQQDSAAQPDHKTPVHDGLIPCQNASHSSK